MSLHLCTLYNWSPSFISNSNHKLVMGDIEFFAYENCHLKYYSYSKYHDTSKIVVTVHEH